MAAITGIVQFGPPLRWGQAAGKTIIAEVWRVPASTAGDTQTIVSTYISNFIGVIGGVVSHTAVTDTEAGVSVPLITQTTIAASNFIEFLLIGYAKNAPPA
jgi:hypothetical protein